MTVPIANLESGRNNIMRIALFRPDIAGNVGTILRMSACFGVPCDIIHPCGFPFSERGLRRAGMDYLDQADIAQHNDWSEFEAVTSARQSRIILLSSKASTALPSMIFQPSDVILMGSESAGVPAEIHERADARVHIPMREGFRSLNVAVAAGIALSEALRQTNQYPGGIHHNGDAV
jgi:tRNA (cytidine/uridine-2'-O-)-methyltransferase